MEEVFSLECWTDGSTIKRQGEGRGPCGIGYVVTDGEHVLFCGGEYIGNQTSNYAEWYAIYRCLEEIVPRIEGKLEEIVIHSDSMNAAKGLSGEYEIRADNLVPLKEKIEGLYDLLDVIPEYHHTPRAADILNRLADRIAYTCSTGYA